MRNMPKNFEYLMYLDRRMRFEEKNPDERLRVADWTSARLVRMPIPPDGRMPREGIQTILYQEKEAGNIPESFTVDQCARLEFVEQADSELAMRDDLRAEFERVQQWVHLFGR